MHLNWKSGILIIYWLSTKYSDGASDALYQTVEAIQGGIAELPCSLEDKEDGDSVYLVLWYRREDRTPIYSYDSRSPRVGGLPDLWSEPSVFGERGTFHPHLVGTPAVLSVKNISKTFDEGDYTCRVDFRQSPTKYHRVRLRVIVPPGQPVLTNTNGDPINDMVGPFREGDTITLECTVKGGIPAPRVHWYRDNILLDDSDQVAQGKSMRNSLTILHFHREHLNSRFRCICFNNNLTVPSEASTRINMIFPPLGVRISSEISPFSVGKQYIIRCISWGSNPPAHLELNWKTGLKVPPGPGAERGVLKPLNITREWNSTKATVIYRPVLTDSGSELACTAVNSEVKPTALIQDSIRLQVYYPPTVRLEIGKAINLEDLEEGDDVYFECSVEANPPPYKVTWLHNDVEILPRGSGNVIMSNHSLVLQKVQREQGGEYRCHASNVEGDGHSEPIQLNVMYAPVCKDRKDRVYGVSENETLLVECLVDAYPSAVSFSWFFNNSLTSTLLNKDLFSSSPGHSVLSYTPHSHMDFGSLLCWADNMVGNQKHTRPCIFHIIPTGPPESPGECRSINQTETQIMVQCRLGYSGGLPQHIHLEIYSSSGYILANMSGTGERLGLVTLHGTNLSPGSQLQLVVYSSNSKGRSQVVKLDGYTLDKDYANKVLEPPVEFQFEHVPNLSVVFVSLTVTILILVISMFLISAYRRSQANSRTAQKGSAERRDHQIQDFGIQRSPDIIKDTPEDSGLNFQDINSKKMNTKTVSSPPEGGFSAGNHEWDETLYYGHQNRQTPQSHEHVLSRGFPIGEDPKDQPAWGEITGVLYEPAQSESISSYNYSHLPQRMQGLRLGLPLQCTAPSVSRVHHRTALLDEDRESCV